ncbi:MAG: GIY-YIG nuclease family protein [Roseibium sp.]
MKDHILNEIRRLADEHSGHAPGQRFFEGETGISTSEWRGKYWARWGDAVAEAGLSPNKVNAKLDATAVLDCLAKACRLHGRPPTYAEWRMFVASSEGGIGVNAPRRVFGSTERAIAALRDHASKNGEDDLLELLPIRAQKPIDTSEDESKENAEGWVYLLRSGAHFKIGRSDDIERRIKQIKVALPDKAEMIHSIKTDDPSGIEAYWHRRFADKRGNGEWFKLTPADLKAFKRRKFQ